MKGDIVHPARTRIAHWANAAVVVMLLWSGFAMFAADKEFAGWVALLPPWFWSALQLTGHRMQGRAWHLGMAIVFTANGLFYVVSAMRSARFQRTWRSLYHAPQRYAYLGVFAMAAAMVLSGVALWFHKQLPWLIAALGGEHIVLPAHVILALLLIAFIGVHVLQVLRAGLPTLLSMITGTLEMRPARTRLAVSRVAMAAAALAIAFVAVRTTSGPTGIPVFLRWAAPARGGGSGDGAHMRGERGHVLTRSADER